MIKIELKERIESLEYTIRGLQTVIKVNGSLLAKTNQRVLRIEEQVKNLEVKNNSKKPKKTIFKIEDSIKR